MRRIVFALTSSLTLLRAASSPASLQVPTYQAPQFAAPISGAYAWISMVSLDFGTGSGTILVSVHPDAASADAGKPSLDRVLISLGQVLVPANPQATPPTPAVTFPTLAQVVAQAAAAQQANPTLDPLTAVRLVLYQSLQQHPRLAGSTIVP